MTMTNAKIATALSLDEAAQAADIVERFLVSSMIPDPETAAGFMVADVAITFTGGRKFQHPREATGFNAKRYKWVKKKMERTDVAPGDSETVVYNTGTLYGEWPDGTPFEGNRYVDRFVVRNGKIVQMDVWNDSAERILARHAIDA
jgi:ketosteroid isomerase-like protein